MEKQKIKIVWICHFTNAEIQKLLPLWKNINEFASWIPNTLKGFENNIHYEIHVISPHLYLKFNKSILLRNINYHFLTYGIPIWHRHWPSFLKLDIVTNFFYFRYMVRRKVNAINPDLINLIGAENAYYSSSVINLFKKYPTLVTIQGFVSEFKYKINESFELRKRISVEEFILRELKYFSGDSDSPSYIKKYNDNFQYYLLEHPVNESLIMEIKECYKKYDCIFFGSLKSVKGVIDFIKVIAEIKKELPSINSCIIGPGDLEPIKKFAKELNCFENIEFVGFVKTQKELFEYVKASKIFLVPPLIERLPSTIREAMFLKVPIVAYSTGAIPSINKDREIIFLVETGDFKEMAKKAILLLTNKELMNDMIERAYNYYLNFFSLEVNKKLFILAYESILSQSNL